MKETGTPKFDELQKLPDDELMILLRNGCDDALAALFDRYHRLVLAIAIRVIGDAGEAEDVMQTVFFDIYKAKAQFDASKGSTRVWILQYAYHRSFNRRQQLWSRNFYKQRPIHDFGDDPRLSAGSDSRMLPPQESWMLVHEALATLNKAQKTALELAYFDGLSMREIADKTGQTLANVRHHFYRGLDKLRCYLRIESKRARATQEEISRVQS